MQFRASHLLWFLLFGVAFLAFGTGQASAETGLASWYGSALAGEATASGEPYNPNAFTAAHKTLPMGTVLNVSHEGRTVQVRINDRGPYVGNRVLDLSSAAAEALGLKQAGVDYVTYTYAGRSPSMASPTYPASSESASTGTPAYPTSTPATDPSSSQVEHSSSQVEHGGKEYVTGSQVEQGGGEYVIQSGDTLWDISQELGTSVEYLASANGIENPDLIYPGTVLHY